MLTEKELGIAMAILDCFEKQTLPRLLWIKGKVDSGELLNDGNIQFLEHQLQNANNVKGRIDKYPEWQNLYASAVNIYGKIIAKALENQQSIGQLTTTTVS
jgi:predicted acylesterase/phospholipase RssA